MIILDTEGILKMSYSLINNTSQFLIIISPYLKLSDAFIGAIHKRQEKLNLEQRHLKIIKIVFICGKTLLEKTEYEKIKAFPSVEIRFNYKLHAKCIMNEDSAVVSSMNLYEASESNYELGTYLSKRYDIKQFEFLGKCCDTILQNSQIYRPDLVK